MLNVPVILQIIYSFSVENYKAEYLFMSLWILIYTFMSICICIYFIQRKKSIALFIVIFFFFKYTNWVSRLVRRKIKEEHRSC